MGGGSQGEWSCFGASVQGPGHAAERMPNQDAWLGVTGTRLSYVVVSDGMGSRPLAHIGARAACRAAAQALWIWSSAPGAPMDKLLRLIHLLWGLRIHPHPGEQCCATCLLCGVTEQGRLVLAKLGDGLVMLQRPNGSQVVMGRDDDGFSNQTTALGVARSLEPWTTHEEPLVSPGTRVLLCTDGVADDLLEDRLAPFTEHLLHDYAPLGPLHRQAQLARALRNWPTPGHCDDKTLAFMWLAEEEEEPGK